MCGLLVCQSCSEERILGEEGGREGGREGGSDGGHRRPEADPLPTPPSSSFPPSPPSPRLLCLHPMMYYDPILPPSPPSLPPLRPSLPSGRRVCAPCCDSLLHTYVSTHSSGLPLEGEGEGGREGRREEEQQRMWSLSSMTGRREGGREGGREGVGHRPSIYQQEDSQFT